MVLQFHDLKGDIVATAADNPAAENLLSTYNPTVFGVPSSEKRPTEDAGSAPAASQVNRRLDPE